VNQGPCTRHY